ncbi:MAG: pyrroline-5-carboxylate reductase [Deltaproteobacteria bacterium]|nr:pyrroline-5-carboxylate reductase [Deltaproteobacteria bacterium]
MNTTSKIAGFIGAGNMATALIKGIIESGLYSPDMINAYDNDPEKLKSIYEKYHVKGRLSNSDLVKSSNIVILAVKPQVMNNVLEEIKDNITKNHIVISIAAGIRIDTIQSILGKDVPVIRVMPNTPALIQNGVSAVAAGEKVNTGQMDIATQILEAVGIVFTVDESMMDAVTAVSGSGPGFVFKIMECFVDATMKQGFDRDTAIKIVKQTFSGASMLAQSSDFSLAELRKMVTSPGGTTEAGLKYLDANRLGDLIDGTIDTAKKRSIELGKK